MRLNKFALCAAIAAACWGGSAVAQTSNSYYLSDSVPAKADSYAAAVIPASCSCSDKPFSACDIGSCDDGGCDSLGCSDEPWKLFQNDILGFSVGGWTQLGYHTYNNTLFNQHADKVRLHQAWLYAEKVADGSCGLGLGGRVDYIYGVDAQDTQSFGILNNHWDNSWDNGIYGHALPQAYLEAAYGDLSVKVGHFFTLIGYEVVPATGNFFYSHSYTMYNSEPFTHTGVMATYNASDDLTLYGGYVLGWDSGFDDNGDAYLGGFSFQLSEDVNITNQTIVGRFGEFGPQNEVGFMNSFIMASQLTDNLKHVFWCDYLDTDGTGRARERQTLDINNYLLYTINDKLTWGNRMEWYNIDKGVYGVTNGRSDVYAFTSGLNYGLGTNILLRPEVRWDWDKDGVVGNELGASQTTFGTDMIFTF